jgi:hypothetical protein
LAEARALALRPRPAAGAKSVRAAAPPPLSPSAARALTAKATTPKELAETRKALERKRREENERRIREYKATMDIMKRRGARAPAPKGPAGAKVAAAAPAAFAPLQIFAEGDSWFKYPPLWRGGIVNRLQERLGVPILNLAKAGDEVRYMLGVEERALLADQLRDGCPAGGPWDVLMFSGGGNDIVDNPMILWLRDFDPALSPAGLIHQPRFDAALALVRAGYEDLITLRNALSPSTHLVFHGYDFAIPDGRGVCGFGPWLEPAFKARRFPVKPVRQAVVKEMLLQFAAMLTAITAPPAAKATFINTQGTLSPVPASWDNELHPSSDGFNQIVEIFRVRLKQLFPDRVA